MRLFLCGLPLLNYCLVSFIHIPAIRFGFDRLRILHRTAHPMRQRKESPAFGGTMTSVWEGPYFQNVAHARKGRCRSGRQEFRIIRIWSRSQVSFCLHGCAQNYLQIPIASPKCKGRLARTANVQLLLRDGYCSPSLLENGASTRLISLPEIKVYKMLSLTRPLVVWMV